MVGEGTFNIIKEGKLTVELEKTSTRLQTYTKEAIPVVGSVLVPVEHNGQSLTLPLIVTTGNGTPLLGRDWLSALQLDWRSIFSVGSALSLQQVLDKHCEVWSRRASRCESLIKMNVPGITQLVRSHSQFVRKWRRS